MSRRAILVITFALGGCVPFVELPTPPRPERRLDHAAARDELVDNEHGRLIIDADEPASVALVATATETMSCGTPSQFGSDLVHCDKDERFIPLSEQRRATIVTSNTLTSLHEKHEPLCTTTPCVTDLAPGGRKLVITGLRDPERTSEVIATVVGGRATALRHTLGRTPVRERRVFYAGNWLLLIGSGVALGGAAVASWGAADWATRDAFPECQSNCANGVGLTIGGLTMIGVGAVAAVTGYLLATSDRPTSQPGATTQWLLPRPATDL